MAVLDNLDLSKLQTSADAENPITDEVDKIRALISAKFWQWYEGNKNTLVFDVHFLFISIKHFRVEDLHSLFVFLFGPENTAEPASAAPAAPAT